MATSEGLGAGNMMPCRPNLALMSPPSRVTPTFLSSLSEIWLTPFSPTSKQGLSSRQDTPSPTATARSDHTSYVVAMQLGNGARLCHFLKCLTLDKLLGSSWASFPCKRNNSSICLTGLV